MATPDGDAQDPVIEAYKKDIDRGLLRENLKLSVEERWRKLIRTLRSLQEWRNAAAEPAADFEGLLRALGAAKVDFIVVGGFAATAHGSARTTYDLDVVYARDRANVDRLIGALAGHAPYLRGAPPGLPFHWDAATVLRGLNFTLTTSLGAINLLGEITGGGRYEDLLAHSIRVTAFGVECWCLGLRKLIDVKRAAGRPKDHEAVAELQALLEEDEARGR